MEDKQQFVSDFQEALIKNGDRRYDDLIERPVHYETDGEREWLERTWQGRMDITCDSLTAIAKDIIKYVD